VKLVYSTKDSIDEAEKRLLAQESDPYTIPRKTV